MTLRQQQYCDVPVSASRLQAAQQTLIKRKFTAYVWQDDFYPEVVERERPDIVLQELLERKLSTATPNDFAEAK